MPMLALTFADSFIMSKLLTVAEPEVGLRSVASMCITVVLPAPFGPKRPKISFSPISSDKSSTAVNFSYFFVRLRICINYVILKHHLHIMFRITLSVLIMHNYYNSICYNLLFIYMTKNVTYLLTILCIFMVLNTMVRLSDVIVKSDIVLGTKIQLADRKST